ncbi:MAG: twitching motility protein PilT [Desulfobulbaceae bacterium S3730MH12]|nr:MAG: twitching motility protein PilT [Desulfobulbaceae bacterium S3730MH12]
MKILFDTNIILDVLLDRKPFSENGAYLLSKVERSEINGLVCATTVTTIHYLLSKYLTRKEAITSIKSIMALFEVASVNRLVIENALESKFSDFEDSVLHESARHAGAEYIVTRNIKDFTKSKIPAYTPTEFLSMIESLS